MAKPYIITGLDLGTNAIKILVASKKIGEEDLEVLAQNQEPSFGIRKGVVIDVDGACQVVNSLVSQIKSDSGQKINSVYINVDGGHIFSLPSRGLISVSRADQKISEEDISRVLQAAQTISLSSNKEIFDVFPQEFIVDGEKGIKEPLGLQGVRLEVEVLALGGFSPYLKNLTQAVLGADLQILDIVPSPLAAAKAVLSDKQKELGVALLDIGAGTSGLCVFEENDLIHLAVIPVGSANITNDIAIGFKTDIDIAERIKIEFGTCLPQSAQKREKIEIGEDSPLVFSQKQLFGIIQARISEIFDQANKELKKISREKSLPAGIVLTGGGAKLPKITEIAKKELKLPCRIGKPQKFPNLDDPSLATVCGLTLSGADSEEKERAFEFGEGMGSKIKKIFKVFVP